MHLCPCIPAGRCILYSSLSSGVSLLVLSVDLCSDEIVKLIKLELTNNQQRYLGFIGG